jgi:hypothetical protein
VTKKIVIGRIGWGTTALAYVVCWLLWSAIALRSFDGPWLGLVWFGVPLLIVLAIRWHHNRFRAGQLIVFSRSSFGSRGGR